MTTATADKPPAEPAPGLRCRKCNCPHLPAVKTYRRGKSMVRVRRCRHCGTRHQTIERERGDDAQGA